MSDWDTSGIKGDTGPAPTMSGTSTTLVTVGTGNKSFTTQSGIAFSAGQLLRVVNPDRSLIMTGAVVSYSGTALVIAVDTILGSGSSNNWSISITAERGLQGIPGPQGNASTIPGPKGDTGPASTVPGPQGIQGETGSGIEFNASGTLADRGLHDNEVKGYAFLETDTSPFQLFIKASNTTADWAGPTYIGGQAAVGDMGLITDSVADMYDYGSIAA